jgi:hypothetical protein
MRDRDKTNDPLPDSFETEENAGAFWDTHSTMDYQEYWSRATTRSKSTSAFSRVQVAEDVFKKLQQEATSLHQSVPTVVDKILRKELA